jgi:hypothetical protein
MYFFLVFLVFLILLRVFLSLRGTLTIFGILFYFILLGGGIVQIENLGEHCQLGGSLKGYVDFTQNFFVEALFHEKEMLRLM